MGVSNAALYRRDMANSADYHLTRRRARLRARVPLLLLAIWPAISDCALSRAGPRLVAPGSVWGRRVIEGPFNRYDPDAVAPCLARARSLIVKHTSTFRGMSLALERPRGGPRGCRSMRGSAPFAAFEGSWQGRWRDIEVAHLWLTVAPGVQLVLLSNNGALSRGINLISDGNQICGIVVDPGGEERAHQGRFFEAAPEHPAHLRWLTPDRNYYERVTCDGGERRYEIVEEILGDTGPRRGTYARYAPPASATALMTATAQSRPTCR